jgi:hypothetical protein
MSTLTIGSAIATFGATAKDKLSNPAASGQPEDQLRAPFERLLADVADIAHLPKSAVSAVGESSISDLKTTRRMGRIQTLQNRSQDTAIWEVQRRSGKTIGYLEKADRWRGLSPLGEASDS